MKKAEKEKLEAQLDAIEQELKHLRKLIPGLTETDLLNADALEERKSQIKEVFRGQAQGTGRQGKTKIR